jgi:3-isopropylmalate/(R)-2-methylmalate dehydratase large subunit
MAAALTLFEKIIHRRTCGALLQSGEGDFARADLRFIHEYYTGMAAHLLGAEFGDALTLYEPDTIVAFEDHLSYVHRSPVHVSQGLVGGVQQLSRAHRAFVDKHQLTHHGYLQALEAGDAGNTGSQGISHALVAERYALPGQLIVGTDSHTPHSGAVGCVAFGVGTTDMAHAFVTGAVRFTMPEVLRIECRGRLPAGVSAKDLVLHLPALPALKSGAGVGRVFEFGACANCGPGSSTEAEQVTVSAINRNFPAAPGRVACGWRARPPWRQVRSPGGCCRLKNCDEPSQRFPETLACGLHVQCPLLKEITS